MSSIIRSNLSVSRSRLGILSALAILIAVSSIISVYYLPAQDSYAQTGTDTFGANKDQIINAKFGDPEFLDAFWTDKRISEIGGTSSSGGAQSINKLEVAPGDGTSLLAVVLVNRGTSDITGVSGILRVPSGFSAAGSSGNPDATANFNAIVKSGDTFVLVFEVEVSNSARIGSHSGSLQLQYSRIFESGQPRTATVQVPFRLPGKVILDAVPQTSDLVPGMTNDLSIEIRNRGSADASGVVVSIVGASQSSSSTGTEQGGTNDSQNSVSPAGASAVSVGPNKFTLGKIAANSTASINSAIYIAKSASETAQSLSIQISYSDAYGNRRELNPTIGLAILPKPPASPLSLHSKDTSILAGRIQEISFNITNNANTAVTDMVVLLQPQQEALKILGDVKWVEKTVSPSSTLRLSTNVFAAESLIGIPASFNVNLQYVSQGEAKSESITLGTFIDGVVSLNLIGGNDGVGSKGDENGLVVTSVRNQAAMSGTILNDGNTNALFVKVLMKGSKIQERSIYLGNIEPDSPVPFNLPIDSNEKSGSDNVNVTVQYQDLLGNTRSKQFSTTVDLASVAELSSKSADSSGQDSTVQYGTFAALAIFAGAAIAVIIFALRRKTRSEKEKRANLAR